MNPFAARSVLLTGAGGSIGSELAKAIIGLRPRSLALLDHSEQNLRQLEIGLRALPGGNVHCAIVGDVCDARLLSETFEEHRPQVVIHAAAFKHVPLMENNPIAAVLNNSVGTNLLARTARSHGTSTFVMVSTDKAVNPHSVMGASKRVAELALLRWNSVRTPMRAVRLGNVFGSQGSVVPKFFAQIAAGGPVTVTHPDVNRFFLSLSEAVELLILAAGLEEPGGIFMMSDVRKPVLILDLARQLIAAAGFLAEGEIPITLTGLRPGDKMTEDFLSDCESAAETSDPELHSIATPQPSHEMFDAVMSELQAAIARRDVAMLLDQLRRLVPEYRPSEAVAALRKSASACSR